MTSRSKAKTLFVSLALTGAVLVATPSTPAHAEECGEGSPAFCGGFELPGGVGGETGGNIPDNGGGGGPQTPPTGKYWWWVAPSYGPCGNEGQLYQTYSTWEPSPYAPVVDPASPDSIQCIEPNQGFGNAPGPQLPPIEEIRAQAKLLVVPSEISSDFADCLVTQSDITFKADNPDEMVKEIDIPGYHVWLEAHPTSYEWTFDSRATQPTASGKEVTTRYREKALDGSNTARIGLTVVWSGELHVNQVVGGGEQELLVDQLGTVSVESNIERSLVEVWSAQTSPDSSRSTGATVQCPMN